MTDSASSQRLSVRPYLVTGGRTRSSVDLALETVVVIDDQANSGGESGPEAGLILDICHEPKSVAEVSALTRLPLQVVKVLIGDLLDIGALTAGGQLTSVPERPDLALLERVLNGLQQLES